MRLWNIFLAMFKFHILFSQERKKLINFVKLDCETYILPCTSFTRIQTYFTTKGTAYFLTNLFSRYDGPSKWNLILDSYFLSTKTWLKVSLESLDISKNTLGLVHFFWNYQLKLALMSLTVESFNGQKSHLKILIIYVIH